KYTADYPPAVIIRAIRLRDGKQYDFSTVAGRIWFQDETSIIYSVEREKKVILERMYFDTDKIETLTTLTSKEADILFAGLSPDKTFLMVVSKSLDQFYLLDLKTFQKYPIQVRGQIETTSGVLTVTGPIEIRSQFLGVPDPEERREREYILAWSSDN